MTSTRLLALVSFALLLGLGSAGCVLTARPVSTMPAAAAPPPVGQNGIDRPGRDYKNFDLSAPDPAACRKACEAEAQCRAWAYVKPGVQGPSARCWLKNAVPAPVKDSCCVSGVR